MRFDQSWKLSFCEKSIDHLFQPYFSSSDEAISMRIESN